MILPPSRDLRSQLGRIGDYGEGVGIFLSWRSPSRRLRFRGKYMPEVRVLAQYHVTVGFQVTSQHSRPDLDEKQSLASTHLTGMGQRNPQAFLGQFKV